VLEAEGVTDLVQELFVCGLVGHRQCYNFDSYPFKRMKASIEKAIRVKFIFESREKPDIVYYIGCFCRQVGRIIFGRRYSF
jgi:hypothetical protein